MHHTSAHEAEIQLRDRGGKTRYFKQWLIAESDGAPNFGMRRFLLAPGDNSPSHSHEWEHVVYILRGRGVLMCDGQECEVSSDDAVLVEPHEEHQFRAAHDCCLEFLCMVPNSADETH